MVGIVFDLGGTHLRCGVAGAEFGVRHFEKTRIENFLCSKGNESDYVWLALRRALRAYVERVKEVVTPRSPMVIAFPGPIEDGCKILDAPTLAGPQAKIPDLAGMLHEETGRPIHIVNDLSAAASYFSTRTKAHRFLVVTVSSGIGSKIYDRSNGLAIDDVAHAGEIGHLRVDMSSGAAICDCGGRGHLGAISSGRGIERAVRRRAATERSGFAWCPAATPETLTNELHILPAARGGDAWTLGVIRDCTEPLGTTLAGLYLGAGLDQIIVIGGFALALGEPYLKILRTAFTNALNYRVVKKCGEEITILSAPDEEACLLGAAEIYRRLKESGVWEQR